MRVCHLQLLIFTAHFWRCSGLFFLLVRRYSIDFDSFHLLLLTLYNLLVILNPLFVPDYLNKLAKFAIPRLDVVGLGTSDRRSISRGGRSDVNNRWIGI